MEAPRTAAELRDMLTGGVPLLVGGALRAFPLAGAEEPGEPVSLSSLNGDITVFAEDLRVTAGAGAALGDIEREAERHGYELFGDPLTDPRATLYDLALSGFLSRMQPAGGRRLVQLNGVRTPTPESDEPVLVGCITAKGVTGYNLARSGVIGRPSLPVTAYELTLKPRREPRASFVRLFENYTDALAFALPKDGPLWRTPGLAGVELLAPGDSAELAAWVAGRRADEGGKTLADLGFTGLVPGEWARKKGEIRKGMPAGTRATVGFEPPEVPGGKIFGYPLAGPWLVFHADQPTDVPLPPANVVLEELWPGSQLTPAATLA
jgi:FAD/FMN-containing dehydrogenase